MKNCEILSTIIHMVGPDFSWLPKRWITVAGGVMFFGLLGLTASLVIAAAVWAISSKNGHTDWAARAKSTMVACIVAVIVLSASNAVAVFLIKKFAGIALEKKL